MKCWTPSTIAIGTELTQELGDFMLQAVFYAQMASEQQLFRIEDALDAINQKLVRRHPHVFGEESAASADEVLSIWGRVKDAEPKAERKKATGLLGGVPRALPALVEAQQIASKAAGVGFDWENPEQVLDKLHEELAEFAQARRNAAQDELEDELGDMLFVLVNLARFVKVDPEQALRRTNAKFRDALEPHRSPPGRTGPQTGRRDHRRNGGPVAGSQAQVAPVEIRQLFELEEFDDVVELQKTIWSFADANCSRCVFWWW